MRLIPHEGVRCLVYAGFVSRALGSSVSYNYVGADARGYQPLGAAVTTRSGRTTPSIAAVQE